MNSEARTLLSDNLRKWRKEHKLTQKQFAARIGWKEDQYQAIESGKKTDIRFSTLEKLAGASGLEVWELLAPGNVVLLLELVRNQNTGKKKRNV